MSFAELLLSLLSLSDLHWIDRQNADTKPAGDAVQNALRGRTGKGSGTVLRCLCVPRCTELFRAGVLTDCVLLSVWNFAAVNEEVF